MTTAEVLLLIGISALAFWRRETLIYFLACFVSIFIGIGWFEISMPIGISAMILGGIMLFKAIYQIITGGVRF